MEFMFETAYNQKAMTAMAKTIRKTVRKKRSRRSHILGAVVIVLALFLTLPLGENKIVFDFRTVITWLVVAVLILTLIFEDRVNGYIARKRLLSGLNKATVTFSAEGYHSETEIGSSEFKYSAIQMLAETTDYFAFIFSQSHAQVYSKQSIKGGTVDEFRVFIQSVTGKNIQKV